MRIIILLFGLILLAGAIIWFVQTQSKPVLHSAETPTSKPLYQSAGPVKSDVSLFAENIQQISHLEITPDGQYMLVGTLPGTIWVYQKVDGVFRKQIDPFFILATSQPGFPPEEAGLTGISFGADFEASGDIFLTYSFAQEKKSFRNRVMRITFMKKAKLVVGTNPNEIFEATTPGTGSHQIQDGLGVTVSGKPHFLFTVGEGFVAERALNPAEEGGKVMLITRDGGTPDGVRPFPESPKVQALGIRNAPGMARNPKNGVIAIADTGPNNYDRFLYGILLEQNGKNNQKLSFNWDGSEDSLKLGAPDLYDPENKEMVLYRWAPTETAVKIAFYDNDKLPALPESQQYVFIVLFGRTGEKNNAPGKKIVLGTLTHGRNNTLAYEDFVVRATEGEGQLGHPLGLAVDPTTKDIYFGDIMEGKIYKVEVGVIHK